MKINKFDAAQRMTITGGRLTLLLKQASNSVMPRYTAADFKNTLARIIPTSNNKTKDIF